MQTFESGDIVSLISHPYREGMSTILFSGDSHHQSPLMVVIEKIFLKDEANTSSTTPSIKTGKEQFKCIWYSHKSQRFESAWILSVFLRLIQKSEELITVLPTEGTQVVFKTTLLEMNKKRTTFVHESALASKDVVSITHMMSFVSPVFLVCGYPNNKKQEQSKKNNTEIRNKNLTLVKVKWFNYIADKFSETEIPIICLRLLPDIADTMLKNIIDIIEKNHYIKTRLNNKITFLKPISIDYLHGYYFARCLNFLTNHIINQFYINDLEALESTVNPVIQRAPTFQFQSGNKPLISSLELIYKALHEKKIIRIKYISRTGSVSIRCVQNFSIHNVKEAENEINYLTGFCLSKNDQRHFNISRIEWVELINLQAE